MNSMNISGLTDAQLIALIVSYDGEHCHSPAYCAIQRIQGLLNTSGQLSKLMNWLGFTSEFAFGMMDGWDQKAKPKYYQWKGHQSENPKLFYNKDYLRGFHLAQESYGRIFTTTGN